MAKLGQALARHAAAAGSQIAMSDGRHSLTRSELAAWVAGIARESGPARETVGIFGNNSVEWAVAFLAASSAGKTVVPVPVFFSEGQRDHLIRDACISRVIVTDTDSPFAKLNGIYRLRELHGGDYPAQAGDGGLIIYTSGSTGNPKGVRLLGGQALWSAQALAKAIGATAEDKYLSVLPLPLLLELICGIIIPVLVGGSVRYRQRHSAERWRWRALRHRRSLRAGTAHNQRSGAAASRTLCGAIGGCRQAASQGTALRCGGRRGCAPVLSKGARQLGIPVYEGYGPFRVRVRSRGEPASRLPRGHGWPALPGLEVAIEDGEIVVQGPAVIDGYFTASPRRAAGGPAMPAASMRTASSRFTGAWII